MVLVVADSVLVDDDVVVVGVVVEEAVVVVEEAVVVVEEAVVVVEEAVVVVGVGVVVVEDVVVGAAVVVVVSGGLRSPDCTPSVASASLRVSSVRDVLTGLSSVVVIFVSTLTLSSVCSRRRIVLAGVVSIEFPPTEVTLTMTTSSTPTLAARAIPVRNFRRRVSS